MLKNTGKLTAKNLVSFDDLEPGDAFHIEGDTHDVFVKLNVEEGDFARSVKRAAADIENGFVTTEWSDDENLVKLSAAEVFIYGG